MESSSKEATEAVKHAEDVAQILRHNIVQGEQQEGEDVLSMATRKLSENQWLTNEIELRIHKDTERGDNDTVKLGAKTVKVGQPCS